MECTNCGDNCSFVKSGFCQTDRECPFYVESWWQLENKPNPKLIKDCFPKKFALEQNGLLHRFLCMQEVLEDVRNRMNRLELLLDQLINESRQMIIEKRIESLSLREEKLLNSINDNKNNYLNIEEKQ
jgi:hypothetical protein